MFSFFKKKSSLPQVPSWASWFTPEEFQHFQETVNRYFQTQNLGLTWGDGVIEIENEQFGYKQLGMVNLAQSCKQSDLRQYPAIVTDHFETLKKARQFEVQFKEDVVDFEKIKHYLGVRLYPDSQAQRLGQEHVMGKNLSDDIYAMLVFDLPHSIMNVQPAQAENWGKSLDELFDTGLENIRKNYPVKPSQETFADFNIWFFNSDHFFTPNVVFDLENMPQVLGKQGALVGIPHRHSVIVYPIDSIKVIEAINKLIPAIYGMNEEGPGSISSQIFWYKAGQFQPVRYELTTQELRLFPSGEFIQMLETLT
ncbi:MAG TPA: hypothetical protein VK168_20460 [Saprospiraceae bacterium]|nr:hypothetical protein [Saprospiraceae bacterium]